MSKSNGRADDHDLYGTMVRDILAMARYALSAGKAVPPLVASLIENAERAEPAGPVSAEESTDTPQSEGVPLGQPLVSQSGARTDARPEIRELATAHGTLSQIVAPAIPKTIVLLERHRRDSGLHRILGPIPLIRRLVVAAILSLVIFIAVSMSEDVTGDFSIAGYQDLPLLLNLLFLLAAAGLGASFAALFQANRFVVEGNYNSDFDPSYWIRFLSGLIAGLILAVLIPIGDLAAADVAVGSEKVMNFAQPTLALLGGFSAAAVYRILNRLVSAVDSLVRGDTQEIVAARAQAAKARIAEQESRGRMETAARLVALQQKLADGRPSEDLREHLSILVNDVVGVEVGSNGAGRPPSAPPPPRVRQPPTKAERSPAG